MSLFSHFELRSSCHSALMRRDHWTRKRPLCITGQISIKAMMDDAAQLDRLCRRLPLPSNKHQVIFQLSGRFRSRSRSQRLS
jgi:hypothetical protein